MQRRRVTPAATSGGGSSGGGGARVVPYGGGAGGHSHSGGAVPEQDSGKDRHAPDDKYHRYHGQMDFGRWSGRSRSNHLTPLNVVFALLWVWSLRSWYDRLYGGWSSDTTVPPQESTGTFVYSLYDDSNFSSARYLDGVVHNVRLLPRIFPGWNMRVYLDDTIPSELIGWLQNKDKVEVIHVPSSSGALSQITNKMMWRFLAASDQSLARYCIRDVDSRLSERDRGAIEEWIVSRKKFHIERDHPSHSNFLISGGLWCGTKDAVPDMAARILDWQQQQKANNVGDGTRYMQDMDFLGDIIWPIAKHSVLMHDAFSCDRYAQRIARGFPSIRQGGEHVGSVFIEGKVREDDVNIMENALREGKQPKKCIDRDEKKAKASLEDEKGVSWMSIRDEMDVDGDTDDFAIADVQRPEQQRTTIFSETNMRASQPKQQTQDMDKPIAHIGGRTCFRYTKGVRPESKGQITSDTSCGAALRRLARRPDVKRIFETGTWYGGGSTHEFAEGIREKANCATNSTHHCCDSFVVSFELFDPYYEHARRFNQDDPVWIVRGSTVGVENLAKPSDIPEEERNSEHFELYYERDKDLMSKTSPKLEKYCNFIRPDVVLIDGNEYLGWAEFKIALDLCRPRYIALHDTGTFKTSKVEKFIRKKPNLFELIESGEDAASWSVYRYKQEDVIEKHGFRIIVLTQRRHGSLKRLLESIDATDFGSTSINVELEIRIDFIEDEDEASDDHKKTIEVADNFKFSHGTKHIHKYTRKEGLQLAWLNAWKPVSDDERAIIFTDDLELSPLWFTWLKEAWNQYGGRSDLGGISLCRQRLRASTGEHVMVERDEPFLYRLPGINGFSPNARFWRDFISWVRTTDVTSADLYVPGTVTSNWYADFPSFWEQAWIWYSWTNGRALYTLYAHSLKGSLVAHWDEPPAGLEGGNQDELERNDKLLQTMASVFNVWPLDLVKFGWGFEEEIGGWVDDAGTSIGNTEQDNLDRSQDDLPNQVEIPHTSSDGSKYVVWCNDFHIATVANAKTILEPKGVKFIDKSLSGHCDQTNTCAYDLKVLHSENGMSPDVETRQKFVDAYKNDSEMKTVDIVMCFHPSAMCELFMPLNKRLFVVASTRYELGRESVSEWKEWNRNLLKIGADSRNLVAANNLYDAKYIEYFTGIKPVLLPSWTKVDEGDMYTGLSDDILIAPMHTSNAEKITKKLKSISPNFRGMREKYDRHTFAQLAENTAIIHIPYQVSIMSLYEQYAMGIPIIAPTPGFLWELHDKLNVLSERTWEQVRSGLRPSKSPIPGLKNWPDPNNDIDRDAFLHWVKFSDWYNFPYIIQFNSWKDLRRKLDETDWEVISDMQIGFVKKAIDKTSKEWSKILDRTENYAPMAEESTGSLTSDLSEYLSEFMKNAHIWH